MNWCPGILDTSAGGLQTHQTDPSLRCPEKSRPWPFLSGACWEYRTKQVTRNNKTAGNIAPAVGIWFIFTFYTSWVEKAREFEKREKLLLICVLIKLLIFWAFKSMPTEIDLNGTLWYTEFWFLCVVTFDCLKGLVQIYQLNKHLNWIKIVNLKRLRNYFAYPPTANCSQLNLSECSIATQNRESDFHSDLSGNR